MKLRLREIPRSWTNKRSWTLVLLGIALVATARTLVPGPDGATLPGVWLPSCPLKTLAGLPCPLCGLTTAVAWLARGDLAEAVRNHVLSPFVGIAVVAGIVYGFFVRIVAARSVAWNLDPVTARNLKIAAAMLLLIAWILNLTKSC